MHAFRHLVVDGHNVIFHFPNLRKLHNYNRQLARQKLIHALTHLQDYSGIRVHLVFDGNQVERTYCETSAISIRYACRGQTADAIIERAVGAAADPTIIAVVTADHAEANMVSSLGATTISPEELMDLIRLYCPSWVLESLGKQ